MSYIGEAKSLANKARVGLEKAKEDIVRILMEDRITGRYREDLRDTLGHISIALDILANYTDKEVSDEIRTILYEALEDY